METYDSGAPLLRFHPCVCCLKAMAALSACSLSDDQAENNVNITWQARQYEYTLTNSAW